MGKVITVWGSPGSGKSMFCCILAKALTRDKRKAIIINADMNVPMLPVWLPEQIIQTNTSKSRHLWSGVRRSVSGRMPVALQGRFYLQCRTGAVFNLRQKGCEKWTPLLLPKNL